MPITLVNALLADLDPPAVERGALRIDDGAIVARGDITPSAGDEVIDCGGAVVLPGLVNGHTHLYSALAVGMPPPPRTPRNFLEILQLVWWRLDQALDLESIEMSARIGALEALRCGTTTLIDHHASPRAIENSLDAIERGIDSVGLRGILCYEVTDRHGKAGREAGLEENRRYARKHLRPLPLGEGSGGRKTAAGEGLSSSSDKLRPAPHPNPLPKGEGARQRFAALFGAHASFTLDDDSILALSRESGVHIHVAEDACDEQITREKYGRNLIERLKHHDLLRPENIFAHCIHLNDQDIAAVNEANVTIAHNPRSNMNNAVGYAPIAKLTCPIMLGTDGIGADMFAESKAAWFKSRDAGAGISPARVIEMLATSARRASQALGVTVGKLEMGAAADVVVTDYVPFTPLTSDNFAGHFIFAMTARHVRDVIVTGRYAMRDRRILTCDERSTRREAAEIARALWQRMEHQTAR
jgi:cytosine/adenosine deaminase-related metal-dependent hydrolase